MKEEKLQDEVNLIAFEQVVGPALCGLPLERPSVALSDSILNIIEKKKRFYMLIKMIIFSLTSVISLISLYFIWQTEGVIIVNSEAGQLLTLLFSDSAIVFGMWREYLLSVVESLPIVSIVLVAALAWSLIVSLWLVARLSKKFVYKAFKHA